MLVHQNAQEAAMASFWQPHQFHLWEKNQPDITKHFQIVEKNICKPKHSFRLAGRVGDTVNKMTYKMEETDEWYEEKLHQIDSLESQLKKLYAVVDNLQSKSESTAGCWLWTIVKGTLLWS